MVDYCAAREVCRCGEALEGGVTVAMGVDWTHVWVRVWRCRLFARALT